MKILLDECLDVRLRNHIPGHDVFTVKYMSWKGIANGQLLALAAAQTFDVMLTVDKGTLDQLPATPPIAVIVMRPKRNTLNRLIPLIPKLLASLSSLRPKTITYID